MAKENNKILCLSRSYLSQLLPILGQHDKKFEYLHIAQTDKEEEIVRNLGGQVALNIQSTVRHAMATPRSKSWIEPDDLRQTTGFEWSAIYSDRYLIHFRKSQRLRIAGALQQALDRLFDEHHFKGFISEPVALFITHLVFYHCKKNNVKPLLWCNTYVSNYFYFSDALEISTPVRHSSMDKNNIQLLRKRVNEYITAITEDRTGPIYHYAFSTKKQGRIDYFKQRKGKASLVLRPGWTSRLIQLGRLLRSIWHRINFHSSGDFITAGAVSEHKLYLKYLFAKSSNYDSMPEDCSIENNIVYPLQYEPEASLLYFAPHIVNQISFVETVLKALPDNRILWVKEHPNQFGALDNKPWHNLKKHYTNLRFIHGRENGRNLIKKSSLVVTISSSMGMDALLLGRHTLVAGKVFYDNFTGAIRTRSYIELARELNTMANYQIQNNTIANINELVEFGRYSYPGDPQPSHYLYDEKNICLLVKAIQTELCPLTSE